MEYSSSNNSFSDLDGEDSASNNYVYTFSGDDCASSAYLPDEMGEEENAPSPKDTRKLQGWLANFDKSSLTSSCDNHRSPTSSSPTTVALNPDDHKLDSFLFSTATAESSHSKPSYFGENEDSVANISYVSNLASTHKEQLQPFQENSTAPSIDASSSGRLIHQRAQRHLEEGRLDEALALFESILKAQRIQYGDMHKFVGAALHNVALVHIKAQRYGKALVVCQEAVMVRRKALGDVHLDLAVSCLCAKAKAMQYLPDSVLLTVGMISFRCSFFSAHD
jgi:tetratricopeptide (TPR) repeat protein